MSRKTSIIHFVWCSQMQKEVYGLHPGIWHVCSCGADSNHPKPGHKVRVRQFVSSNHAEWKIRFYDAINKPESIELVEEYELW